MGIFMFPKDANFRRKPKSDVHYLYKVFRSKPFELSHKGSIKTFKNVEISLTFYYDVEDALYYFETHVDATEDFPRLDMLYTRSNRDVNISYELYESFTWLLYCGIQCDELSELICSINKSLPSFKSTSFRRVNDCITKRLIRKYTNFADVSSDVLPF